MIAVIADDFTGAAEIAGLGWRHGLRAELLARGEPPSEADLVVYDSDSRNCSPAEARRRVVGILKRLHLRKPEAKANPRSSRREEAHTSKRSEPPHVGCHSLETSSPDWIFKKVDSVLRGNVTAEIEAAMTALQLKRCLLAPANPDAGRIIRGGKYYICGAPIHRTDFRNDPRHPRLSARVVDLLGRPGSAALAVLRPGTKALREGINIGEATGFKDVQHWADLADEQTLAVGGADFFRARLLKHLRGKRRGGGEGRRFAGSPIRRAGTLFVCGSLAESSREFFAECRAKGWPVLLLPEELLVGGDQLFQGRARHSVRAGLRKFRPGAHGVTRPTAFELKRCVANWARQIVRALRQHSRVVVGIGRPRLPGKQTPARLGKILTDTVRQVLKASRPGRVCVEGGATAALLLERMGWRRLSVEVEFATGVTGARPHNDPDLLVVCKPGSYLWPATLIG